MIQEGLYATLAADAGVSALVGARVYPVNVPQSDYTDSTKFPCVVYNFDGKERQVRFSGTDTLVSARLSIDCYAKTYAQAQAVAEAVRGVLKDYSGTMVGNGSPQSSNRVQSIFIESESDAIAPEPGLYVVMQDYLVWYDEA